MYPDIFMRNKQKNQMVRPQWTIYNVNVSASRPTVSVLWYLMVACPPIDLYMSMMIMMIATRVGYIYEYLL